MDHADRGPWDEAPRGLGLVLDEERGSLPYALIHGEALVACAGVTLRAVATSIGVDLRDAKVTAEGDLDFRGTLGVSKEAAVGFRDIRLTFELDTDASEEQRASLLKLTERYCVVLQTLRAAPPVTARVALRRGGQTEV